jgi:mono/diheme cytochrome c family protein
MTAKRPPKKGPRIMLRVRASISILIAILAAALAFGAAGDGAWLRRVPAKDRVRVNPTAGDPDAPLAGAKVFAEHCAQCHGEDARGKSGGKHVRPNLRSQRVQQAPPGSLFWLLTNGSQRNGMPSRSRRPDAQRWQLIAYLKTLE